MPEWLDGKWSNPPLAAALAQGDFLVAAEKGAGVHGLLSPMPDGTAVEVSFLADLTEQFDQAGIVLRSSAGDSITAGLELIDGVLRLGESSRGDWAGRVVTIRLSRNGDDLSIDARADDEQWERLRQLKVHPELRYGAGPYLAAQRDGLTVRFTRWSTGPADAA